MRLFATAKDWLVQVANKFLESLPFLVFFVVLFFAEYALFGPSDALLGIIFLFFSRTSIDEPGLSFPNFFRRISWFVVMGICASFAGLHPVALVVVTVIYMFAMTVIHSDDYLPRNFFWLGMGYLLLLIYPISLEEFPLRIVAMFFSVGVTTAFVYIMRLINSKTRNLDPYTHDAAYIQRAFDDVAYQLNELADQLNNQHTNPSSVKPKQTYQIAQEYCRSEYGTVFRQNGLLSGRQCYTLALLLCCEQIADMIHATAKSNQDLHSAKIAESVPASFQQSSPTSENEQQFFRGLAKVFLSFSAPADPHIENPSDTLPRISDAGAGQTPDELLGDKSYAGNLYNTRTDITDRLYRLTVQLEGFLASHNLDETCHNESWRGILEALVRTLKDKKMQHSLSTPFWRGVKYRLMFLKDNMGIKHTQTRFALQLAFIVGLAMAANVVLTEFFDAQFAIWIPITAFTVLNTYNDETLKSTLDNAIGTFIGIAVFAFFVHFIPEPYRMPLVVSISYLLILMNIGPTVNVASGTQMALTALYPYTTLGDALISRLVLVVLAVSCVMMIIFVFMRTQRAVTIRTKIQELERIDVRLATHIHKGMKRGRIGLWRSVQLLYYLHMDSWLLDKLVHSLNKDRPEDIQLKEDIDRVLALNYKFAMDAEHAVMLLDPRRSNTNRAGQTDRFAHIDATADRLDTKMHSLEQMHYLGEDADRD